jgi:hypothetical protein
MQMLTQILSGLATQFGFVRAGLMSLGGLMLAGQVAIPGIAPVWSIMLGVVLAGSGASMQSSRTPAQAAQTRAVAALAVHDVVSNSTAAVVIEAAAKTPEVTA